MGYDLPAGGKRLLQGARGYRATVVSGAVTYVDGEATGALPGRLVRAGRDTAAAEGRNAHEHENVARARAGSRVAGGRRGRSRVVDRAPDGGGPGRAGRRARPRPRPRARTRSTSSREDFPLDGLAGKLQGVVDVLLDGRGFARIATLDTDRFGDDDLTLLYWGIGLHLGQPWAQNKHGHVLGDVTDQGKTIDDPTVRGNELGGIALDYHTDGSDLVGLLCLRTARPAGSRAWPMRWPSTTSSCASTPTWPPRSTSRCPTTPGANRPRARTRSTPSPRSPSTRSACSCASSRSTSWPRSAIPTHPA